MNNMGLALGTDAARKRDVARIHKEMDALCIQGVSLSSNNKPEEAFRLYLQALALDPTRWLPYQNAGHACVSAKRWRAAHFFHQEVRRLDPGYTERDPKDQCGCLVASLEEIRRAQAAGTRLWRLPEVTASLVASSEAFSGDVVLALQAVDFCYVVEPDEAWRYVASFTLLNGRVLKVWFNSWDARERACIAAAAVADELNWRRRSETIIGTIASSHPVLRQGVLQHIFGFLDWKDLTSCALVSRDFYRSSLCNALWRDLWLRHPHKRALTDVEINLLTSEFGSFGHDGFLRNLLLQRTPLVLEVPTAVAAEAAQATPVTPTN